MREATKLVIDAELDRMAIYTWDGELLFDGCRSESYSLYRCLLTFLAPEPAKAEEKE